FTAGLPSTVETLQIRLTGSKALLPEGSQPRKSLVSNVPQPALKRMRRPGVHFLGSWKSAAALKSLMLAPLASVPPKYACRPRMSSTACTHILVEHSQAEPT